MAQFYFEREVRTPNGECYTILEDSKPVGRLDIHFVPGLVHATMVVNESLTQEAIQELISMVDEDLTDAVGEPGERVKSLNLEVRRRDKGKNNG